MKSSTKRRLSQMVHRGFFCVLLPNNITQVTTFCLTFVCFCTALGFFVLPRSLDPEGPASVDETLTYRLFGNFKRVTCRWSSTSASLTAIKKIVNNFHTIFITTKVFSWTFGQHCVNNIYKWQMIMYTYYPIIGCGPSVRDRLCFLYLSTTLYTFCF